jgi:replication factor A1
VQGYKPLNNGQRFRLLVSDGVHCNPFAMLATQLNELVENKKLNRHCIIRVNKHVCNTMTSNKGGDGGGAAQRRILILLELDVLKDGEGLNQIGNPVTMNNDGTAAAPPAASNGAGVKRPLSPPRQADQPKFKAPTPAPAPRPPPARNTGSSYGSSNPGREAVVPITMLTPYSSNWTLRARVTQKADVRTYSNSRGEGKLFSMTLADESGEIRITFFNEAVDRFVQCHSVCSLFPLSVEEVFTR